MRTFTMLAMLAAMAATAFAQDPNRNRMNDPYPEARQQEKIGRALEGLPSPYANRMNVQFQESTCAEMTGGPNPYGNRMNVEWPKSQPKAQPKETERLRIDP